MEFLPLVVDGILILIFAACIFEGRRRGFIKMVLSVIAVIISIGIAHTLSVPVAAWANEEFAKEGVTEYIEEQISGVFEENGADSGEIDIVTENGISEVLPEELVSFVEKYGVSLDGLLEDVSVKDSVEQTSLQITERILDALLLPVLETIAFIIIYIICSSLLSILVSVVGSLFKLPIINGINKLLGGILGAVKGLAVIAVLSVLAVFAAGLLSGNELADAVSQATLTNTISETVIQLILGGK